MSPAKPPRGTGPTPARRGQRHPQATKIEVRFTDAAIDDLTDLSKKNTPAVRWALKKCLVLEQVPEAGEPLGGSLTGFRKITVSNRDWRIVWRVTYDDSGTPIVDVAEVWAVGARSDSEVYREMRGRVASLPPNHQTKTLAEVIALLEERGRRQRTGQKPTTVAPPSPAEAWQVADLVNHAEYPLEVAQQLTKDEATKAWEDFRRTTESD